VSVFVQLATRSQALCGQHILALIRALLLLPLQTEQLHAAALAEDPNAFSYDEVYEDIHAKKHAPRVQEQVERKVSLLRIPLGHGKSSSLGRNGFYLAEQLRLASYDKNVDDNPFKLLVEE